MIDKVQSNFSSNYTAEFQSKQDISEMESFKNVMTQAAERDDLKGLKEACQNFESFFIQKLFEQMRSSSATIGGAIEKSQARETFEKMLDEELSKEMSEAGGIGLSKMLYDSMLKQYSGQTEKIGASDLLGEIK